MKNPDSGTNYRFCNISWVLAGRGGGGIPMK